MSKEEVRLIDGMFLTKSEVEEAVSSLYNKHGKLLRMWRDEKKNEEISKYWIAKGKNKFDIT